MMNLPFREIWCVDFEYRQPDGELPVVHCVVAVELRTGHLVRQWFDEFTDMPPYNIGPDSLFVAYAANAEFGCHLALGWPLPAYTLDLYVEFLNMTNGYKAVHGKGLRGAMLHHGLEAIEAAEKSDMRDLAIRGGPFTPAEREALVDYCESDVRALQKLLPAMLANIEIPYALLRGRYMRAVAAMYHAGVPIDMGTYNRVQDSWDVIRARLTAEVDKQYGVFEGKTFKQNLFLAWCQREGIPWPRLDSGKPDLKKKTFKDMTATYPQLEPLYELRATLSDLRTLKVEIGSDGRNRSWLNPFGSRTSRNQPSSTKFIFGNAKWLRYFIKPTAGQGLAYIDWSQQEFAIAAVFSSDANMQRAYESGDPYMEFAVLAGAAPAGATKDTHGDIRKQYKECMLAVNYGMSAFSLAARIKSTHMAANDLLKMHKRTFPRFWCWSQNVSDHTLLYGAIQTSFGWTGRPGMDPNDRSIRNFPVQAAGAEIMRLAAIACTEAGIKLVAPVHDAFLIEAPLDRLDDDIARTREIMADASAVVLGGLRLGTDVDVVRYPDRYRDPEKRGLVMWEKVLRLLEEAEAARCASLRRTGSVILALRNVG